MKQRIIWIVGALLLGVGGYAFFFRGGEGEAEIEYRYAKAEKGELLRSISATGLLEALTTVDVKSKAGGKVVQLAVDEGSVVKRGELVAVIDPSDTQAVFEQASADLTSAQARASQARSNYELQVASSKTAVADARAALDAAKIRLSRSRLEAQRQPTLSRASLATAQATLKEAQDSKRRLEQVTIPQQRRQAQSDYDRTKAELDVATAEYNRQSELLKMGYTPKAAVERAQSALEAARSSFRTAEQELNTLERDIQAQLSAAQSSIDRAQASLQQAQANQSETVISNKNVEELQKAVRTAEINLQRAMDDQRQNEIRYQEWRAAQAATVRNRVSVTNAKVQLDSTTVVAPRDGVVTMKYLEEGTIIPPGTSTFAQGTSLVQISDVTTMFVECAVDEADISQVKPGQNVRIIVEAYPSEKVAGVVERINPAAQTEQNVTAIKVRVRVLPGFKAKLLPGMNATCEFITLSKNDVLKVPQQAITREGGKTFVKVKTADPLKPKMVEVTLGEQGNDGIEVLSGVSEGEEVVIAEIDLKALRETQERMQAAQEGGGLAGGGPRPGGGNNRAGGGARGGAGAGGGGARPGGR